MLIFKTVIQTTINPALQIPPREAVLNNNEAGSNDDDKGHGEEVRKSDSTDWRHGWIRATGNGEEGRIHFALEEEVKIDEGEYTK